MSHITSIMKKEIREMLSPGSIASILFMVILFAAMGGMINDEVEKSTTLPTFGIVADSDYDFEYDGKTVEWNPVTYLRDNIYKGQYADKMTVMDSTPSSSMESIVAEMSDKGLSTALILPLSSDFKKAMGEAKSIGVQQVYTYSPSGMFGSVSSTVMTTIVSYLNADLSAKLIGSGGDDYSFLTSPLTSPSKSINTIINGVAYSGVTPYQISTAISSQTMMIPLVIMIIITMIGSIVISSMGAEKENKTLETLLTLPIKRTSIVTGKIIAAAVVGLIYGLAYMAGMSIYMGSLTSMVEGTSATVNLADVGMALDLKDWALVMVSMFLAIVCALGLCMILGAFSKNYKSAQTMTMPLSILAMIPMFVIMFSGWYGAGSLIQGVCFAIPFSHPMMAMQALMNGDMTLVLSGIGYMALFALATILLTVRIYASDILITGLGQNKWVQKLTGKK